MKIAVFAGHGGSDMGAVANGLREKDFTLGLSNAITSILRGWGFEVVNNRTTDVIRSITNDARLANQEKVDALVEIHLDCNEGTPEEGAEAYVSIRDDGRAKNLAYSILRQLEKLGFKNRGVYTSVNAEGIDTFGILRLSHMPAVILEVAFLNNPQDMERIKNNNVAEAIARGIILDFPTSN
jgi:N-acetylmuramoyl-L-alanine amidase